MADHKTIYIAGATGAGTNYPVLLKVGESGGSVGADFNLTTTPSLFPSAKNDPGDIIFNDGFGAAQSSWVEQVTGVTPNRVAWIWVKVAADLGSNQTLDCTWNWGSGGVSDGSAVFELFDDFDTGAVPDAKWTFAQGAGNSVVSAGVMTQTGSNSYRTLQSASSFADGREVIARIWPPNTTVGFVGYYGFWNGPSGLQQEIFYNAWSDASHSNLQVATGGGATVSTLNARYQGQFYRFQTRRAGGAGSMIIDGTQRWSAGAGVPTASLPAQLMTTYDNGVVGKVDWIAVKKYQAIEPVFSALTAEVVSKLVGYAVTDGAVDAAGISKLVAFAVIDSNVSFASLGKLVAYAVTQPPPSSGRRPVVFVI